MRGKKIGQRQIRHRPTRGIKPFCLISPAGLSDQRLRTYSNITFIALPKLAGGNLDLELKKTPHGVQCCTYVTAIILWFVSSHDSYIKQKNKPCDRVEAGAYRSTFFFTFLFLLLIFVSFAKKENPRCLQLNPFFLLFLVTPLSTY